MQNIKTIYRKQLIEHLKNGKCTLKTPNLNETKNFLQEKKKEIRRYFEFNNLITNFGKVTRCITAEKRRLKIVSQNNGEALTFSNDSFSKLPKINIKLEKVIDIFYPTSIPPIIKSKKNVIVLFENGNPMKKKGRRIKCPDCLKEEVFKEMKQKIAARFKDMIVMVRKKLLKGLINRKEFIINNQTKPAFLIMDDLVAPFPEVEPDPIPVFSFAEDKPQERPKCKTETVQNDASKKDTHASNPQGIFYEWTKDALLKSDEIEPPSKEEKPISGENKMYPSPPQGPENCSKSKKNVDFLGQELENRDSANRINYNKNSLEVITKNQPYRDSNDHNKGKFNNIATYENSDNNRDLSNVTLLDTSTPTISNMVEDFSFSVIDLSNPSVAVIPVLRPKEKGKRNIIIKLKNVPETVDVIKIKSIMSTIRNACETKNYSKYFLKNRSRPSSYNSHVDTAKNHRRKFQGINYQMTCPNKQIKPSSQLLFPAPYFSESNMYNDRNPVRRSSLDRMKNNDSNLRCCKKNYCYNDE